MAGTADVRAHPAFAGFGQVLPLSGFSGAAIALLKSADGAQFVRKAAAAPDVNSTLQRQAGRQQWLRAALDGAANVPDVLSEGEKGGLYFFDMEFVPSRDANAFLSTASFADLTDFATRVERLMGRLSTLTLDDARPPSLASISTKLQEIARRTEGRFESLLEPLQRAVDTLGGYSDRLAPTVSHGDLTFENILVNARGELWLIDPIESPIDHYWIDWSKLFQDCEGRWHMHRGKPISLGVTRWLRNRWFAAAVREAPDYASRHYVLLGLTFARILPYVRTSEDVAFISERLRLFGQAALQAI